MSVETPPSARLAPTCLRVYLYLAWSAAMQLLLIGVTWGLWFPGLRAVQTTQDVKEGFSEFPAIGLLDFATLIPQWLDFSVAILWTSALLVQMVASLRLLSLWQCSGPLRGPTLVRGANHDSLSGECSGPLRGPTMVRGANHDNLAVRWTTTLEASLWVAVLAWMGLVVFNQHRLQAWGYLAVWIQGLYLLGSTSSGSRARLKTGVLQSWRWLIISVYFYSAISKFDHTFLSTLGSQFLTTGWNSLTGARLELGTVWPLWMTLMFPVGELIVAVGLASGQARRWFVLLALLLHVGLLWLLGPWGMQHQAGVLLWNVFFIGQVYLLFWPVRAAELTPNHEESLPARLALLLVLLIPLAQPAGWCDSWLAWELYAPRGSRIQVFVAAPALEALPELESYVEPEPTSEFGPLWRELRIDQWSLDQLHAPIYPQDRFQLGVALAVADRVPEPEQVFVRWLGTANRWTGQREQKILRTKSEMEQFGQQYFWNFRAHKK